MSPEETEWARQAQNIRPSSFPPAQPNEKGYFGFRRETTLWSYSHGQPLWFVDLQKILFAAFVSGILGALFHAVTGHSLWWVALPLNALFAWVIFR